MSIFIPGCLTLEPHESHNEFFFQEDTESAW